MQSLNITRSTEWVEVNSALFSDPRLDVLSKEQKKGLFEKFRGISAELEEARAQSETLSQADSSQKVRDRLDTLSLGWKLVPETFC